MLCSRGISLGTNGTYCRKPKDSFAVALVEGLVNHAAGPRDSPSAEFMRGDFRLPNVYKEKLRQQLSANLPALPPSVLFRQEEP